MKFSFSWLKEVLATKRDVNQISSILNSLGIEVDNLSSLNEDTILELSFTPNLCYAMNTLGIAREISAITQEKVTLPAFTLKEEGEPIATLAKVKVENKKSAPRYLARVITGVKVGPSPAWLVKKLEACGLRSINNVVDITNYVLLELGLPLHAFDLDKIKGKQVIVRNASKGEKIVTLDGKEHFPTEEMLLICDKEHPLAIAGVMGGLESEVTEETHNVFLEAAYFIPTQVRKTSKHLGIHTEASHRFERGVDPNSMQFSLDYAAALIQKIAGGKVAQGTLEITNESYFPKEITCRVERLNQLLGLNLSVGEVEGVLKQAGFTLKSSLNGTLTVSVPTFRVDLLQEIDLIEEVARLYGYDHIFDKNKPLIYQGSTIPDTPIYLFEKEARKQLLGAGLQELLTCDLISPEMAHLVSPEVWPSRSLISLLNPSSVEQSVLRPSLFPNMLTVVKYNHDHGTHSLGGFEIGRVHFKSKENYIEQSVVGIVLTGKSSPQHWNEKEEDFDFFHLKGVVENLMEGLKIEQVEWKKSAYPNFHPGRQAALLIAGHEYGVLGQVHPKLLKKLGLSEPLFFAEISIEEIHSKRKGVVKMEPVSPFPASTRDWTLTTAQETPIGKIFELIQECPSKFLESFSLLDVYQSEKLGSDWKNVTLRFVYRDLEQTISQKAVEEEHGKIIQNVTKNIKIKPEG